MRSLANISTFIQVARAASFAEGAARLGVSTSAASKAVQRLEEELGVKLFHRTTRSVTLTVEGERFLQGAERLVVEVEAVVAEITDSLANPRGRLVISAPAVFGRLWLTEKVLDFMCRYPQVEVELSFDDRQVDLAAEGVDVAIRIGELTDSANIVARKLFDDEIFTCASPDYIARHGVPERVEDFAAHRCLHYRVRATGRYFPFLFVENGVVVRRSFDPFFVANSVDAMKQAAERGLGIAQLPSILVVEAIREGRLVSLLPAAKRGLFPYSIIYLDRRLVSPRIRAFVDFLVADPPRFLDPAEPLL
ncbi:MAG: LysR family transcriptional regulator [Pseudomonadota bacterium]